MLTEQLLQKNVSEVKFQEKQYDEKIACKYPIGYFTSVCPVKHMMSRVFRCHDCEGCEMNRIRKIKADLITRVERAELEKTEVLLWTLGTNWKATQENIKKIKVQFTKFLKLVRLGKSVNMYFRVFESGSKSNYLHVHFVTDVYSFDHKELRKKWSQYTNIENPNVNFKRVKRCKHCKKIVDYYKAKRHCSRQDFSKVGMKPALLYLTKYLTKNNSTKIKRDYYIGKPLWYQKKKSARIFSMTLNSKLYTEKHCTSENRIILF